MKKQLVALALLSVGGAASAQSTVTLFGVVDAAISHFSNASEDAKRPTLANPFYLNRGTVTLSQTELRNSGYNTSRLGFRGTEDLGGGLAASFWLEGQINNDDGTGTSPGGGLNFMRRSTVSLSGGFGEVRLGRDYNPTYWNNSTFDPFGQVGSGANLLNSVGSISPGPGFNASTNYPRASNSVGYFLPPSLGGVYGQLMYAFPETVKYDPGTLTPPGVNGAGAVNPGVVATTRAGRYAGGRVGYAKGPLEVAVAYGVSTTGDNFFAGTTDNDDTANFGASYDFGILKLFGEVAREKHTRDYAIPPIDGGLRDIDLTGYIVGFTVPIGVGLIRASYAHVKYDLNRVQSLLTPSGGDPRSSKLALGYVYNLSKRTALYATVARINNKNGAAVTINGGPSFIVNATYTPASANGYDFGIRHAF